MSGRGAVLAAAGGAALARGLLCAVDSLPVPVLNRFDQTNYCGATVSLTAGPAAAVAASVAGFAADPHGLGATALWVGLSCGAFGAYDDLASTKPGAVQAKGLRGHVGGLRRGRLSGGLVKLVGITAVGLAAGGALAEEPMDRIVAGGVVAGTANLVNLLDLRPGRAVKAVLLLSAPVLVGGGPSAPIMAGSLGTAAALLPGDLAERRMLGDCGANAIGALLGLCLTASCDRRQRLAQLGALVALTLASEWMSFTRVIEQTPVLRELDRLGRVRRPAAVGLRGSSERSVRSRGDAGRAG